MKTRIMQQVGAKQRPLSFDACGTNTLLLESASTAWAGLQFEVHRTVPGEARETGPLEGEFALVVFLEGTVEMAIRKRCREFSYRAVPGSTSFLAGDERPSARVIGSAEVAAVKLTPEWLHRVELEQAPAGFGRLPPLSADQTMRSLASAMRREVESGAGTGRLYAESLSLALLSYVADRLPVSRMQVRGAFSEAQRRRLAKHIHERLGEDLALTELAAFAGLGPRQFSKLFREAFGVTPHRYLLNQRLDEGARRLATSSHDVADIALALGFSSQSHFAAAFRKRFAQSPRKYAIDRRHTRTVF
jgi:AraC family transcriptional regulator